ncbi:MAG: BamA/TamA family outer membrane protein, partial [Deltaproteobacteria bacterium]|nr:BamA/TamA family outer membrane protein [Deltaproteobacteria bacterium]
PRLFEGLSTFAASWRYNEAGFGLVSAAVGDRAARIAIGIGLMMLVTVLAWRARRQALPIGAVTWAFTALVVMAPALNPWYVAWLLPFAVVVGARSITLLTITVLGYYTIAFFERDVLVRVVEFVPPLVVAIGVRVTGWRRCCLVLTLVAAASDAVAQPRIRKLEIEGLDRTREAIARRELIVREGDPYDEARIEESAQRLRNTLLFSRVTSRITNTESGDVDVAIAVDEKWTTIPIVRVAGGGGTTVVNLGAYDINVLGSYVELGGQYENVGGAHSGVAWIRDPRFLGRRLLVGADVWSVTRIRRSYTRSGELEGAYALQRKKLNGFVESELHPKFRIGGGAELDVDSFDDQHLEQADLDANMRTGLAFPEDARTVLVRLTARAGRLDHDNYLVSGATAALTWEAAERVLGSELGFHRVVGEGIGARRLPWRANVAARVLLGAMTSEAEQQVFRIGGLEHVRGFFDGQFVGSWMWVANLEYRIPSLATRRVVLQHTAFVDLGQTGASAADLVARNPPVAIGLGIRLLSPRIHRLVLRLDYALAFSEGTTARGISFGVQQFF